MACLSLWISGCWCSAIAQPPQPPQTSSPPHQAPAVADPAIALRHRLPLHAQPALRSPLLFVISPSVHSPPVLTNTLLEQLAELWGPRLQTHIDHPLEAEQPYPPTYAQPPAHMVWLASGLSASSADALDHPRHLQHYVPLLTLLDVPWCLYARADTSIDRGTGVLQPQNLSGAPVRLGLYSQRHLPVFWAQAIAHNAQRRSQPLQLAAPIGPHDFDSLRSGKIDLLLGFCAQRQQAGADILLVAATQPQQLGLGEDIPSLVEIGLPPLPHGWVALLVPKRMPTIQRLQLAVIFEKLVQQPPMQAALRQAIHPPMLLDHQASVQYLQRYARTWSSVAELMQMRSAQE